MEYSSLLITIQKRESTEDTETKGKICVSNRKVEKVFETVERPKNGQWKGEGEKMGGGGLRS